MIGRRACSWEIPGVSRRLVRLIFVPTALGGMRRGQA